MKGQVTCTEPEYLGVLLLILATICSTGLLIWMMYGWIASIEDVGLLEKVLFTTISALVTPIFWIVEVPKLKSVEIGKEKITFKNLFTRGKSELLITDFDGFKTTGRWASGGPVYEIILFLKGRPFHIISSSYIKNYDEVRNDLDQRFYNLGAERFKYFKYLKEQLTK